jgi:arginine/lysine/ornithine decarboxylase
MTGLDNLSSPTGVIREAQQLAARAFGADRTWFLVNGTSCGLHAAVLAAGGAISASEASTLVVARNCHLSAISAMVLAGTSSILGEQLSRLS